MYIHYVMCCSHVLVYIFRAKRSRPII